MSQGISRESLLIYLNDIRMMETILFESRLKINELQNKKANLKNLSDNDLKVWSPAKPDEPVKPKSSSKEWFRWLVWGILIPFVLIGIRLFPIGISLLCIGIIYLAVALISPAQKYKVKMQEYASLKLQYQHDYNIYSAKKQEKIENYKQEISKLQKTINQQIYSVENSLKDAYNANIIPAPFRNIQGIYYLYDYLSTSNESLTSALIQANLESIKQKLDKMISLQGTMIIQQAQANRTLFEQNQRILEAARNIENNSAVAAQYSQISAINSEVSLILQAESLAYQEADFWLRYN